MSTSLSGKTFSAAASSFSFMLLGDLHFDRLEHHDYAWLEQHHAGDLSQIKNYSKLTAEVMPRLLKALKARCEMQKASGSPLAFTVQVGDLVEGLCGSEQLARRQNQEALDFIEKAELGLPFVFTKGNHDVTGDGAIEAFNDILLPFAKRHAREIDPQAQSVQANHLLTHQNATFAFLDAYDRTSLEWLESVATARTSDHFFVVVHPPVVPYGARATWYLFSDEKSAARRERLIEILAKQQAIVLGGHLHKFSALTRRVGNEQFTQLAVSSVVSSLDDKPRDILEGMASYTSDQIQLEPKHSPDTVERRRAIYDRERNNVTQFEYANTAGYAIVTVDGSRVDASIHVGLDEQSFRQVRLKG